MKYHHSGRCFTYLVTQRPQAVLPSAILALSDLGRDLRGRQRQVGSLAGAAHLLNDNTGVLRLAQ